MRRIKEDITIFALSGFCYCLLEILWRRYTHWTMLITGGLCFLTLFRIYSKAKNMKMWEKCAIGALVITVIEFISGCIVNLWLRMDVWDYSSIPGNVLGQICLLYSFLWGMLSIPISYVSAKIKRRYM